MACRLLANQAMKVRWSILVTLAIVSTGANAQLLVYDFTSESVAPTENATNVSGGDFSSLGGGTTSSGSPVAPVGTSRSFYFYDSGWTSENYFQFTISAASGYEISLSGINFYYRSTSTGPVTFDIRSSSDSYASSLANGSLNNDSDWYSATNSVTLSGISNTTVRIYASTTGNSSATGGGTLRIDDVDVLGSVNLSAVPEPSTYAALAGLTILGFAAYRRRHRNAAPLAA